MFVLDWQSLLTVNAPSMHLAIGEENDFDNTIYYSGQPPQNTVIRYLRGKRCMNDDKLFQEIAAALQFPWYFGNNWNALNECLRDLDWLEGSSYLILISQVDKIFINDDEGFRLIIKFLNIASEEWANQGIPFRVIFQCEENRVLEVRNRFSKLNLHLPEITAT